MRNGNKRSGDFLRLQAEGEEIKKEVEGDEALRALEVTPEMDREMEQLIQIYEREKERRRLVMKTKTD